MAKLQTIDNTYLLEYFWLNGGMLSGGSVWLSTGLRVWVVSVYSYGVKSLVRGVWLALWRLGFCVSVWVCFCVFGLAWVRLGTLGLVWVGMGTLGLASVGFDRLENLLNLRSCQDSRIGYKLSWFYAFLIGGACLKICISRCFLLVLVLSRK